MNLFASLHENITEAAGLQFSPRRVGQLGRDEELSIYSNSDDAGQNQFLRNEKNNQSSEIPTNR